MSSLKLPLQITKIDALPKHIAVIMDGNGRWAKRRLLPRVAGHKAGLEAAHKIIQACYEKGIEILTLFAFSSENWGRPKPEVDALMQLFISALRHEIDKLHKNNIQLKVIGDMSRISIDLREAIISAQTLTQNNTGLKLVVAVDYGGQWDIIQAARKLVGEVVSGKLQIADITPAIFEQSLSTHGLSPPDLLIRTSGEQRISNFLLWQLAYSELYFTETLWPDFDAIALEKALQFYMKRERRFGGIDEAQFEEIAHA